MYQVYRGEGMELIYSPNMADENYIIYDAELEMISGEAGSFAFTVPRQNPAYPYLDIRTQIRVTDNGDYLFDGFIYDITTNLTGEKIIYCKEVLAYLDDFIDSAGNVLKDVEMPELPGCLKAFVAKYNSAMGTAAWKKFGYELADTSMEDVFVIDKYSENEENGTQMLAKILSGMVAEIKRNADGKHVIRVINPSYPDVVEINHQKIEVGKNILSINITQTSEMYTMLRARGTVYKRGLEGRKDLYTLETTVYADTYEMYGPIMAQKDYGQFATDDDTHTNYYPNKAKLEIRARQDIKDMQYPKRRIEAEVVDVSYVDPREQCLRVNDMVNVVVPHLDVDAVLMITSARIPILEPEKSTFTIGGYAPYLTRSL